MADTLKELENISVPDRLQMIQAIWQSIEESHESLPLSKAHEEELDRRLEAHRLNPRDVISWDEIRSEYLES